MSFLKERTESSFLIHHRKVQSYLSAIEFIFTCIPLPSNEPPNSIICHMKKRLHQQCDDYWFTLSAWFKQIIQQISSRMKTFIGDEALYRFHEAGAQRTSPSSSRTAQTPDFPHYLCRTRTCPRPLPSPSSQGRE